MTKIEETIRSVMNQENGYTPVNDVYPSQITGLVQETERVINFISGYMRVENILLIMSYDGEMGTESMDNFSGVESIEDLFCKVFENYQNQLADGVQVMILNRDKRGEKVTDLDWNVINYDSGECEED